MLGIVYDTAVILVVYTIVVLVSSFSSLLEWLIKEITNWLADSYNFHHTDWLRINLYKYAGFVCPMQGFCAIESAHMYFVCTSTVLMQQWAVSESTCLTITCASDYLKPIIYAPYMFT